MITKAFLLGIGLSISTAFLSSTTEANVLEGATEYAGHYYKSFEFPVSWDDAKIFCESVGGHLATAENSDEIKPIHEAIIKGGKYSYWIGGKRDQRGLWHWVTGPVITYPNWTSTEPSAGKAYDSMTGISKEGKWATGRQIDVRGFICEWDSANDARESNM